MKTKYYIVKTVDNVIVQITEKKMTKRDAYGRFTGKRGGYCRWKMICPLAK